MIKVSIITVCYNSASSIRKTIESVLNQSYQNIEYIIIDGGSSDQTIEIIKEYSRLFGERMKLVSEADRGIYDAMNKGLHMASGDLIGILNSDDYYEKQAVENMVMSLKDDKYQILYGFIRYWKESIEYAVNRQSHFFLRENMIGHPACFVTKAVYDDFGGFDLQYVSAADYDFMLRMSKIPDVNFYPVDFLVTNFEMGGMSSSDIAWLDLLKLKKDHAIISEKEYKKELIKSKVYLIFKQLKKRGVGNAGKKIQ